jgi:hypothetical protein
LDSELAYDVLKETKLPGAYAQRLTAQRRLLLRL